MVKPPSEPVKRGQALRSAAAFALIGWAGVSLSPGAEPAPPSPTYETRTVRGRVVWLGEALQRKFGIAVDADAARSTVAVETSDGSLVPLVKDFRGRGFHLDPKLRELDWELLMRAYPGAPAVQVVRTYVWRDGRKYEFDYWCDICAIPMYELKDCECCQGPIRFRFRETKD